MVNKHNTVSLSSMGEGRNSVDVHVKVQWGTEISSELWGRSCALTCWFYSEGSCSTFCREGAERVSWLDGRSP